MSTSMTTVSNSATNSSQGSMLTSFLPLILIMIVFYFLLIRPQQKRIKDHQIMLSKINKGDKVITSSGIYGTIFKVEEKAVVLEINENSKIKVKKENITEILID